MADYLDGLWPENAHAWDLFRRLATRLVVDVGLGGDVFRRLTATYSVEALTDLLARLDVIYDVTMPPPAPPTRD